MTLEFAENGTSSVVLVVLEVVPEIRLLPVAVPRMAIVAEWEVIELLLNNVGLLNVVLVLKSCQSHFYWRNATYLGGFTDGLPVGEGLSVEKGLSVVVGIVVAVDKGVSVCVVVGVSGGGPSLGIVKFGVIGIASRISRITTVALGTNN